MEPQLQLQLFQHDYQPQPQPPQLEPEPQPNPPAPDTDGDREAQLTFWAMLIRAQWEDMYAERKRNLQQPNGKIEGDRAAIISAEAWFRSDDANYATSFRVVCENLSWDYRWVRKMVFAGPPPRSPGEDMEKLQRARAEREYGQRKRRA